MTHSKPAGITCPDWEPDPQDSKGKRCKYYHSNGACKIPTHFMCVEWLKRQPAGGLVEHTRVGAPSAVEQKADPPDPLALDEADVDAFPAALDLLTLPAQPDASKGQGEAKASPSDGTGKGPVAGRVEKSPSVGRTFQEPIPMAHTPMAHTPMAPTVGAEGAAIDNGFALTPPPLKKESKAAAAARRAYVMGLGENDEAILRAPVDPFVPAKEIREERIESLEATCAEIELDSHELTDDGTPVVLVPKITGKEGRTEITFRDAATMRLIVDAFPGARVVKIRKRS